MNDDFVILNVLDSVVHAVLALPGGPDPGRPISRNSSMLLGSAQSALIRSFRSPSGRSSRKWPGWSGPFHIARQTPRWFFPGRLPIRKTGPKDHCCTQNQSKGGNHPLPGADLPRVKGFFPPIFVDEPVHNAPVPRPATRYRQGFCRFMVSNTLFVRLVQPFVA